jgi:uroporphyrin-III C-methyltransferase
MTLVQVPKIGANGRHGSRTPGCVYLVGAGPGDPDLLTVRALRLIQEARILVYDRLVSDEVLALASSSATRIFVGKCTARHAMTQDEINALLVELADRGDDVVRLKGGDPFVFGRGGEEAEYLVRHGVPFDVVPGITAASGCTAALGIPLTHRGVATGARFVTGHCRDGVNLDLALNWNSLADPATTLVVYMGLANSSHMSRRLQAAGLPPDTPVLAISSGTTPQQRTCRTTLHRLPDDLVAAGLSAPVLLVIGEVVAEAERIGISNVPVEARDLRQEAGSA